MFFKLSLFGIILMLASLLSLYFIHYSYSRRDDKIYYYFIFFLIFCFLDFFLQGLDVLTTPFIFKSIFGQLSAIGYCFVVACWFLLIYYLVYQKDASRKLKIGIFIIPIFCAILALTNPWTHIFISSLTLPPSYIPYKLQLYYHYSWGFSLIVLYNFMLSLIMIVMITKALIKSRNLYRNSLLSALIMCIVCIAISLLAYTPIYPSFSWTLLAYVIALIFLIIVIELYGAFDVMSIVNDDFINDVNIGILYFNDNNVLKSANPLSKLISVEKEDINKDVTIIFKDNPEFLSFYNDNNLNKTEIYHNEKWIEVKKKIMIEDTDNLGKIFTLTDVSKKVYELEQKDMLVKELNHRVKNNLQIILSLLNLDMRFHPEDPELVLEGTRSRLNYMFTLHDKIYRSSSNTEGDIKDYLPDIAKSLLQMYESNIKVWQDMDNAIIGLDLTIPLGLILTEMINNTIKYAFPDNNNGNFYIKFKKDRNKGILDLYDDGKGFPDGFDFESSSGLGMTVIKSLTSQIDGEATIISDQGAHLKIVFPIN